MDDLWNVFASTGRVEDYLRYKENECKGKVENTNEAFNQGVNHQGTDNRRER